ncbi:MAG: UDP-N-acetylmuramoyl-tripeptide--D-alanyl-D-alanine ligase [Sediminibacterium sp.]|uniref:UDP-N-acetylmuramoyl-tripeptide--D-alanyl-D- alanine ligase n=1 Tax=Umezakia ovalisporum TaxID=75695 RepID=UPI0024751882|nr:UDP-N-acetylmuramoyl-tripeptide--D-alanyl-D-alanine ligase [Umezakia ovalisporum]MBR2648202.1 UDP-N-acetylmuramoyl-tripeptide--D-alanyl-D-alanine ligase [Sediminibacterium sp.]MBX9780039.1 UDP-N-acetylmuramoyl-tripeptide--D-alanyl-D-alanine ligase [Chitinophagaceae bacterium]MDH6069672.1 UDP-N-acetylmuramoyl-tripeptide--D-alanyl-D-alanine ligase [Umezakia ovalisporum CobakiLakeA]
MIIEDLYKKFLEKKSVQTDTRKLKPGDIFFALKGPNFNGNLFAQQALNAGAAYAVVDEATAVVNEKCILVDDCLHTLQALAKYHRQQFQIPFIAITGSNGKTTSKELIAAVLSSHFKTYTTEGNLNNHIGVPLTILRVGQDAAMAVIEMGANHQKEIAGYCAYTLPTHGVITNTGKAHLEGFGGIEGVRKGKGELYDFIRAAHGTIFIYDDYDYLKPMSDGIENKVWYGQSTGLIQGTVAAREPFLQVAITKGLDAKLIKTKLVGDYNLPNVLCAATIGKYFGVPDEKIVNAIESYTPSNSRSQLLEHKGNHIILDAYNANPSSMKVAIENFAAMHAPAKILMLGAMKELGEESLAEHQALIQLIDQYSWKAVVLVGGDFEKIKHSFTYLSNAEEARQWLIAQDFHDVHILIKGSRGIGMERVVTSE